MSGRVKPLGRLKGEQADASDPNRLVWLSASAGTGKTHVLTARVLRLLLGGADPAAILCLTFTKAGAAEMADRIHARLARWVRLDDAKLAVDLQALGEDFSPPAVARARTLFARVLEATGGGLRIQTIHAFCQTLLAGFPDEAGLVPGFRLLEGREEQALARSALGGMLTAAEAGGDLALVRDVQTLSRRLGEDGAETFLRRCGAAPDAMKGMGASPGIEARLRRALGVPSGDIEKVLAERCGSFECAGLSGMSAANAAWGTGRGRDRAALIDAWIAMAHADRAAGLVALAKGIKAIAKGHAPQDEDYIATAAATYDACSALLVLRAKAAFAADLAAGLRAGQAYARAWRDAKRAAGAVDFDDLIATTRALLGRPGMGDWVRWKLDQRLDHILVDEAQDTNLDQWQIVAALAAEFFAGEGAKAGRLRTIFTVGDFKQAIFGFQGTSPDAFEQAAVAFARRAEEASVAADAPDRRIDRLSLATSFRSTPPVLALVDSLLEVLGHEALGLDVASPAHVAARAGPGRIELWAPVTVDDDAAAGDEEQPPGEEGWLDDATRLLADKLARQIRAWIDARPFIASRGRPLRPEDILVLVRKRGDLAGLIVARLHVHGVPVAGVDRLRLDAPLAVRDLLSAARFALQPDDDLNLASLLVSPLIGLSQDDLFAVAYPRRGTLWSALRDEARFAAAAASLATILASADLVTPYRFFEEMLSGSLDGRRRMLERLGEEARDPIDELLNAALAFEDEHLPQLQSFVDWFDRGEVQIKRDPSAPLDAVRVMTVHGAKGLQAPLVVLADATVDPEKAPVSAIDFELDDGLSVPGLRLRKEDLFAPLDDTIAKRKTRDMQEHWRLLYVAATRAEEWLAIGGALGSRAKGVPPAASWYARLAEALAMLPTAGGEDAIWRTVHIHAQGTPPTARMRRPLPSGTMPPLPDWLRRPAPAEDRPPRPLAPSAIGHDDVAAPPPGAATMAAAERGRLLHALFERLPAVAAGQRLARGTAWLARDGGIDPARASALVAEALAIIEDARFADIFTDDALAEAPIAAVVDGEVIAGTVDRLLVRDEDVTIVDFKTGSRVPANIAAVPGHHLAQMGAYAAALSVIFPDRRVRAALLYTAGPTLLEIDDATLARNKPGLRAGEQSLDAPR